MAGVGEGVLGVELQVVELEVGEEVDGVVEVPHGGHAVAGEVEHDAARGEGGAVLDAHAGENARVGAQQLNKRGQGVACAVVRGGRDGNRLLGQDGQGVGLRGRRAGEGGRRGGDVAAQPRLGHRGGRGEAELAAGPLCERGKVSAGEGAWAGGGARAGEWFDVSWRGEEAHSGGWYEAVTKRNTPDAVEAGRVMKRIGCRVNAARVFPPASDF